ncbi:MAG: hypothetical protein JNJ95_06270 [Dechloromonas sp.]|nr:hypothetical protein [Dechloromonas sp.]
MKKITALFIAATLAITSSTSALADRGHRHGGYGHGHHGHRGSHSWAGPAAVLAIAGLAIGAAVASRNSYAAPPTYSYTETPAYAYTPEPTYYRTPPRPAPAEYGTWYYCSSSGQYYPYTNACPEGWQAVPTR